MDNSRNIEVAKRLGYHIYHYNKDVPERCYYSLWLPEGMDVVDGPEGEHKTEAEAWNDAPKWDKNLSLALALVQSEYGFRIETDTHTWYIAKSESENGRTVSLDDLPGAIVDWWLANVDVKALKKQREIKELKEQIASLQEQLRDLESETSSNG